MSKRFPAQILVIVATLAGCPQNPDSTDTAAPREKPPHLVALAPVTEGVLSITSIYTGSLRSRRMVRVFNQEQGRVTALPFYEGDRVAAGTVVLALDNTLLQAELDKAVAKRREASVKLLRVRSLQKKRLVTDNETLRANTALEVAQAEERVLQARLGYTRVKAPFDALVSVRTVEVGDFVPLYTHVLTLIDPRSMVTDLQVSELLIPHLAVDDPVTVRIDALGDREFDGRVLRMHPELDPVTRQGRVEIELKPVPAGAMGGQFARVTFNTEALDRKVVPYPALRQDRDGEFVYRLAADGSVERIKVRTGRRLADRIEILDGLDTDDQVVTKGFLGLKDGMEVSPVDDLEERGALVTRTSPVERPGG